MKDKKNNLPSILTEPMDEKVLGRMPEWFRIEGRGPSLQFREDDPKQLRALLLECL